MCLWGLGNLFVFQKFANYVLTNTEEHCFKLVLNLIIDTKDNSVVLNESIHVMTNVFINCSESALRDYWCSDSQLIVDCIITSLK